MYYEDLTNSIDNKGEPEPNIYMVGWLDEKHEFPKGKVTPFILERVLSLCFVPIRQTRGFHQSPFIDPSPIGYPVEYKGRHMRLGSAEIRVDGKDGKVYRAPNLIYHYMKDCGYLPPQDFLIAIAG